MGTSLIILSRHFCKQGKLCKQGNCFIFFDFLKKIGVVSPKSNFRGKYLDQGRECEANMLHMISAEAQEEHGEFSTHCPTCISPGVRIWFGWSVEGGGKTWGL